MIGVIGRSVPCAVGVIRLVWIDKEIAVSQPPQKSSKLRQQQILRQRRLAAVVRQQKKKVLQEPRVRAGRVEGQSAGASLTPPSAGVQKLRTQRMRVQVSDLKADALVNRPLPLRQQSRIVKSGAANPGNRRPDNRNSGTKFGKEGSSKIRSLPVRSRGDRAGRIPRRFNWFSSLCRLGLLGLGLSAMVGTAIATFHPEPRSGTLANSLLQSRKQGQTNPSAGVAATEVSLDGLETNLVLSPDKELKDTKAKILALASPQTGLVPGVFVYNPETQAYLDIAGDRTFAAASTIKFPILVAFFQEVDAKRLRLDEMLVMRKDLIASEAGNMQYQPVGTKFSALETADKMITISDNTATNMLIDKLGGKTALNARFKGWGLTSTVIQNLLPDLGGTNRISPKDLSMLMLKVAQGELLTPHSRDRLLDIMRNTITNTLLTPGLGEGAKIAHKTGDIRSIVGDVGLIEMPNGQRYVATAMVQRPDNDPRAQELIRQMSKLIYQALSRPTVLATSPSATSSAANSSVNPSANSSPNSATSNTEVP